MILLDAIIFPQELGCCIQNKISIVHSSRPTFLFIMFIILCTNEYERVGCNYYFQKYESNGGTRGNPRGPSNTTLQWFSFQKNNTVGIHCIHGIYIHIFFKHFYATERKGFWCLLCRHTIHLSYFKSFSIIHLELDIVTVGLR